MSKIKLLTKLTVAATISVLFLPLATALAHGDPAAQETSVLSDLLKSPLIPIVILILTAAAALVVALLKYHGVKKEKLEKTIEWAIRLGVGGTFIFHGSLAIIGTEAWLADFTNIGIPIGAANILLRLIGIADLTTAALLIFKPIRLAIIWASIWPIVPMTGGILLERGLAHSLTEYIPLVIAGAILLILRGFPKSAKDLFRC